ncbi:hypothetical protein B0T21DRAFT_417200 [Apiosordaria backusii]|uniref:Uncharacterized protein n=1 Tax=Apiosordaria backusii TaxID=314023 RepID=A0AA40DHA8_9PEZI|nr:hypothetical protein B0T21DRAFT_417200 [Apiosordaria backusii]
MCCCIDVAIESAAFLCPKTLDLCLDVPTRVHNSRHLEDYGAIKAQHYWAQNVGPLALAKDSTAFKGSIGPRAGAVSSVIPESVVRAEAKRYAAEYIRNFEIYKNRKGFSHDLRKYLEAMLYSISGNIGFSLDVPRHNLEKSYNDRQLDWIPDGVPATSPSLGLAALLDAFCFVVRVLFFPNRKSPLFSVSVAGSGVIP